MTRKKNPAKPLIRQPRYWTRQLAVSNFYGGWPWACWRKRRLVRRRPNRPGRSPTKINPRLDDLIFYHCRGPAILALLRRLKKVKFKKFQKFSYPNRRRFLRVAAFFVHPQNRLRRYAVGRRPVRPAGSNTTEIYHHQLRPVDLDFNEFSYRFVRGGLVCGRPPVGLRPAPFGKPYYEGGTPDLVEKKNQQIKRRVKRRVKRRLTKVKKLFLRRQRKVTNRYYPNVLVRLAPSVNKDRSYIHYQDPPEETRVKRFWRVFKLARLRWWERPWWTTDVKVHLAGSAGRLRRQLARLYRKKVIPPVVDTLRAGYRSRFTHAQRDDYFYENRIHRVAGCYTPRWKRVRRLVRSMDPVHYRWAWSVRWRGSLIAGRSLFIDLSFGRCQQLVYRLSMLYKRLYMLRAARTRLSRHHRHLRVIEGLPSGRRLRRYRRRYFQRRQLRLRRAVELNRPVDTYYWGASDKTFSTYRVNRFSVMELNNIVRGGSFFNFLCEEYSLRRKTGNPRFFFPYYYNYFRRRAQTSLLRGWRRDHRRRYRTKSGLVRMKTIKDHPVWGLHFNSERVRRFDFLRDNIFTRLSRRVKLDTYKFVPYRYDFSPNVYSQKVDTRRKLDGPQPINRSLMTFFLSFVDGLTLEKKQKKIFPAAAAAAASFNRASLNLEVDLAPPVELPRIIHRAKEITRYEQKIRVFKKPSFFYRYVLYYVWFYFFTPVWWVYYGYARLFCWLIRILKIAGQDLYDELRGWFLVYFGLARRLMVDPFRAARTRLRGLRVVRLMTWVYTSWLYVDLLENHQYELDRARADDAEDENEADEEIDPDGDLLEDEDDTYTDIGYNRHESKNTVGLFFHGNPVWEWYIQNIPDEEVESVLDDVGYFTRLLFRPFVDFIVRLPFWSLLELTSLWLEVLKKEYHRVWFEILTHGNQPDRVYGRWWKVPLVGGKCLVRLVIWLGFTSWMVNLISSGDLKILLTYELGLSWYEEYYYLYVVVCFLAAVYLVGPLTLRDFCFKELGFEGLAYIFVAPASVSRPEAYQPQRPGWKLAQNLSRWDLNFGEKEWPLGDDRLSGRYHEMGTPNGLFSYDDIRVVLAQFNEFGLPYGGFETEEHQQVVDLHRRLKAERYNFNMSERHPHGIRNEWYRGDRHNWDHQWTIGNLLLKQESQRYLMADTSNQYWNRTIVHRREYPQNLRGSFDRR